MNNSNMKTFLLRISLYIIGVVAVLLFLGSYADGNTDDNYMHFTGAKPSNIILGDSRGAQAIVPDVLNTKFKNREFNNFAFNIAESPYGKVYFEALKKKINPHAQNGIFILTVSPWNVSVEMSDNNVEIYPESISPLVDMCFYDLNPNYEYLLKNYTSSWFNIYRDREEVIKSKTYLHKNGWMEVTVNIESDTIAKRQEKKIKEYTAMIMNHKISQYRIHYLEEMIKFLKDKGSVYLVRIPVSKQMLDLEYSYCPNFNVKMREIADKNKINYFDFSERYDHYIYTDGNHMYKESGKVLTTQIADSIFAHSDMLKK
ncbi:hypothetical protein D1632_03470 [Chryseobacterium nematophagum]|uniref:SGNH/GDSL hydrolase family protein n=2 Tax=Chryseobacterium nematophagum TaxID=2305228 RepID=A0A3M7LFI7_9FLAO|nr:hypothetical protein D1632_03470 [Chryseobacterium nematophagum]